MTITFFDLMVTNAALQGVPSHMWLTYTDHFTRALLKVHDESKVDPHVLREWRTRSAELLYRIVAALIDWIELIQRLPADNVHRDLKGTRLDRAEHRIPRVAIIALADVLDQILRSDKVNDAFKRDMVDSAVRCVAKLPKAGDTSLFRDLLIRALTGEALLRDGSAFAAAMWDHYRHVDHVRRSETGDLAAALRAALPPPLPRRPIAAPIAPPAPTPRRWRWLDWFRR